jgi:transcriptional regulator with XRE-family HTH domain
MATMGERIRELRERQRLTQDDLASRASLSKGFLSEIENNKRKVGSEYLLRIANALGASVDYLLTGRDEEGVQQPLVIPRELNEYAEREHLSYKETMELLAAHNSVVSRRSNASARSFSVDDWKNLHETLKRLFGQ